MKTSPVLQDADRDECRITPLASGNLSDKQKRTALLLTQRVTNGVHTAIPSGLSFQPACPATLDLTRHTPASHFIFTPSHFTFCLRLKNSRRSITLYVLWQGPMTLKNEKVSPIVMNT